MSNAISQLSELWRRMKWSQRIAVILSAAGTLALIGSLVYYGSQPNYGVLFSDLKPADAQTIVEKLKSSGVPYQISNGGTTVSVPFDRIPELRLSMAGAGVISGGHVGFDIFDRSNFGATDFAQQVNYQRAIEGELARTLEGMDEVETARVHITRPRESIFADKAERAKASIVLRVRQGRELSRERTEAAVNLVSSAVEGLDPADISLMDTRGRLLSAPTRHGAGGIGEAGAFASNLETRRKLESETAARIVSLIEPITGVGHVRSDVAAELDFSQIEQTEEKYNPQSAVIRSQQTSQEARGGANPNGGIAGTRSNDPSAPQPTPAPQASASAPSGDQRSATTTNYEIDKTVKRTLTGGGGRVTRMSVSVVVDYKSVNGTATARTPEELKKMQDLVAAAVGIDTARGDQIVVQTIPFDQPTVELNPQSWQERYRDLIQTGIKYGALILAALILVIFVIRPAKRALRLASAVSAPTLLPAGGPPALTAVSHAPDSRPALIEASNQQHPHALPGAPLKTVAEMEAEMEAEVAREIALAGPKANRAEAIKKQIVDKTQKEAEMVAMTMRGWLQDQR